MAHQSTIIMTTFENDTEAFQKALTEVEKLVCRSDYSICYNISLIVGNACLETTYEGQ